MKIKPIFFALLFSLVFACLYFILHYQEVSIGLDHFDEGIRVFSAVQFFEEKVSYRDFFSIYPPGYSLYIASFFKLFGVTLFNHRLGELMLYCLSVFTAIFLIADNCNFLLALIAGLLLLTFPTNIALGSIPIIISAYIFLMRFVKSQRIIYLFISGLLIGFCTFFRIDFAFYSLICIYITLFIHSFINKIRARNLILFTISFMTGIFCGTIPLIYYAYNAGFVNTFSSLVLLTRQTTINMSLPYPSIFPAILRDIAQFRSVYDRNFFKPLLYIWIFYFPYLLCLITTLELIIFRKKTLKDGKYYLKILLVLSVIIFSIYMHFRSDINHTWPVYFFIFMLLPVSLEGLFRSIKQYNTLKYCLIISIIVIFSYLWSGYYLSLSINYLVKIGLFTTVYILLKGNKPKWKVDANLILTGMFFLASLLLLEYYRLYMTPQVSPKDLVRVDVPRAGNMLVSQQLEGDYVNLIKYLLKVNPDGKPIFVGSTRHDMIFVNDILLLFLSGANSATSYWWYATGIQSQPAIQEKMVAELEKNKPEYAVLWVLASNSNEPNASSISSQVFLLDDYLKNNYQLDKRFGNYFVAKRIDRTN